MGEIERLAREHSDLTRRYFLKLGAAGLAAVTAPRLSAKGDQSEADRLLAQAVSKLEYLTREEDFTTYGRGDPPPHKLPPEKRPEVGLTRETWQLEVVPDPESNSKVERPLSKAEGTALNWDGLMKLAQKHAVRYMSVTTCTNGRFPCGMGLWAEIKCFNVRRLDNSLSEN